MWGRKATQRFGQNAASALEGRHGAPDPLTAHLRSISGAMTTRFNESPHQRIAHEELPGFVSQEGGEREVAVRGAHRDVLSGPDAGLAFKGRFFWGGDAEKRIEFPFQRDQTGGSSSAALSSGGSDLVAGSVSAAPHALRIRGRELSVI